MHLKIGFLLLSKISPIATSRFHRFSELPAELRILIWKLSLHCGENGQLMYPIDLRDPAKGPAIAIHGIPRFAFEIRREIVSNSRMSCDFRDIGVSRANKESRSVYLKIFTKSAKIHKGILRYPPNAIIFFSSFSGLFARHYYLHRDAKARSDAFAFLGEVKHAALSTSDFLHLKYLRDYKIFNGRHAGIEEGIALAICELGFERISVLEDRNLRAPHSTEFYWMNVAAEKTAILIRSDLKKIGKETDYQKDSNFKVPIIDLRYKDRKSEDH